MCPKIPPTYLIQEKGDASIVDKESNSFCNNGAKCLYSHNKDELDYHPLKYKTELCSKVSQEESKTNQCDLYCPYSHSNKELRVPNQVNKTETPKNSSAQEMPTVEIPTKKKKLIINIDKLNKDQIQQEKAVEEQKEEVGGDQQF